MEKPLHKNFVEVCGDDNVIIQNHQKIATKPSNVWSEFLNGNELAMANIYREYVPKLFNYGRQFSDNDELVKDCIQDVFFKIIKNRKKLGEVVSIKLYLFACLRRRLVRQTKRNSKIRLEEDITASLGFQFLINSNYISIGSSLSPEIKKILENACNKLPQRQREAIMLYFFEELTYKDIAVVMQLGKVKSVRTLVYRALDTLSGYLEKWKEELI